MLALVALLGVAGVVVVNTCYFVGVDDGQLAVYSGLPWSVGPLELQQRVPAERALLRSSRRGAAGAASTRAASAPRTARCGSPRTWGCCREPAHHRAALPGARRGGQHHGLRLGVRRPLPRDRPQRRSSTGWSSSPSSSPCTWWCASSCAQADPYLLPVTALLAAIGLTEIFRIRPALALLQGQWLLVGALLFVLTVVIVRDHTRLDRYRYLIGAARPRHCWCSPSSPARPSTGPSCGSTPSACRSSRRSSPSSRSWSSSPATSTTRRCCSRCPRATCSASRCRRPSTSGRWSSCGCCRCSCWSS